MNYKVVIPAAGEGKRMKAGKNKLWLEIGGKPLIVHAIEVFQADPECEGVITAVAPSEQADMAALFTRYGLSKVERLVSGGAERQHSVHAGLKACARASDAIVLIHDGARPFVTHRLIRRLTEAADKSGAAIPAVPVKDTVKRVNEGRVAETLERSSLWAVQTPQAFRLSLILQAHEEAAQKGKVGTDDASLVEWSGHEVTVVTSDYDNLKVTTPEDLVIARAIMMKRREELR
ncbi:MAG TPA: 2-C-methyl-D-erythritol 4-phosphate cytidylyltransferase [Bacillales bacterium]|nr:2-C-methyl-D-erythritol 4-phosphate cytidylyltransferase [Bacillales bacterium]